MAFDPPTNALIMLAQAAQQKSSVLGTVWLWLGILIVVVIAGGVAIMMYRRKVLANDDASASAGGMMDDLRRMRDSGQMSQEEYDAVRRNLAAKIAGRPLDPGPSASSGRARAAPAQKSPDSGGNRPSRPEAQKPRPDDQP